MLPTSERIGKQLCEFSYGSSAGGILYSNALCYGCEINSVRGCRLCSARGLIDAVVEDNVNEIFRLLSHDGGETTQVHQKRAVAV